MDFGEHCACSEPGVALCDDRKGVVYVERKMRRGRGDDWAKRPSPWSCNFCSLAASFLRASVDGEAGGPV